jgi:hypothetical protein
MVATSDGTQPAPSSLRPHIDVPPMRTVSPTQDTFAPRRFRLSLSVCNGLLSGRPDSFGTPPVSFMSAIPIAAPCYAVRLGFANIFSFSHSIASAAVYPSDTYSESLMALATGNTKVVPTNSGKTSTGCPIYFDGIGDTTLNLSGVNRRLTIPGNHCNPKNAPAPYTIVWSDWSPCTSLPRKDGGKWPLLFVYITIESNGFVSTASDYSKFNAALNRGRKIVHGLRAEQNGVDFADNPGETDWKPYGTPPFGPWFVLQYVTTTPSIQIAVTGDSLVTSPLADAISNPVWRAAADLTSSDLAVEVLNLGWGAATWKVYNSLLGPNLAAIQPSIVVPQVISRNSMGGTAQMQQLLAMAMLNAQAASALYGSKLIWNIPGCQPTWNASQHLTEGFVDVRNRLLEASKPGGIPIIDAPSVIGDVTGGAPWNYIASPIVCDDNAHPNAVAQEMVVPLAKDALKIVIGLD